MVSQIVVEYYFQLIKHHVVCNVELGQDIVKLLYIPPVFYSVNGHIPHMTVSNIYNTC